ncbi:hypothetical protein AK812_SmicGene46522, partial [Symbiodinium microadriaticum]
MNRLTLDAAGYGDLWAGSDATFALATLSLEKKDRNRLDWTMEQFNDQQLKALAAWSWPR